MIDFLPCGNVICRTLSIKVSFWSDRLSADHGGQLDYLNEYAVVACLTIIVGGTTLLAGAAHGGFTHSAAAAVMVVSREELNANSVASNLSILMRAPPSL